MQKNLHLSNINLDFEIKFTVLLLRCSGIMASMLASQVSGLSFNVGRGHCVVFLCKTFYSYSTLRNQGVLL